MYKFLFELFIDPLSLPINPLYEYIILAVIGVIAFKIAWEASPGGTFGSEIHWTVRLIVFVVLWAITDFIIMAIQWLINNWVLTLIIVCSVIAVIIMICLIGMDIKRKNARKETDANETVEKQ